MISALPPWLPPTLNEASTPSALPDASALIEYIRSVAERAEVWVGMYEKERVKNADLSRMYVLRLESCRCCVVDGRPDDAPPLVGNSVLVGTEALRTDGKAGNVAAEAAFGVGAIAHGRTVAATPTPIFPKTTATPAVASTVGGLPVTRYIDGDGLNCVVSNKRQVKKKSLYPPKRPKSSYCLYSTHHRPILREKNPAMLKPDVTKELLKMWKATSPDERKKYEDQVAPAWEKYKDEVSKWKKEYQKGVMIVKPTEERRKWKKLDPPDFVACKVGGFVKEGTNGLEEAGPESSMPTSIPATSSPGQRAMDGLWWAPNCQVMGDLWRPAVATRVAQHQRVMDGRYPPNGHVMGIPWCPTVIPRTDLAQAERQMVPLSGDTDNKKRKSTGLQLRLELTPSEKIAALNSIEAHNEEIYFLESKLNNTIANRTRSEKCTHELTKGEEIRSKIIEELIKKKYDLLAANKQLEEKLRQMASKRDALTSQIKTVTQQHKASSMANVELTATNERLEREISHIEVMIDELTAAVKQLTASRDKALEQLDTYRATAEQMSKTIKKFQWKIAAHSDHPMEKNEETAVLVAHIEGVSSEKAAVKQLTVSRDKALEQLDTYAATAEQMNKTIKKFQWKTAALSDHPMEKNKETAVLVAQVERVSSEKASAFSFIDTRKDLI